MPGELGTPTEPLFRLGRAPDPLAWPAWRFVGEGRFDDPRRPPAYRVLYAGERLACFYERLAEFRVDLGGAVVKGITADWIARRRVGSFTLDDPARQWRWLDLASPATYAAFRRRFGALLTRYGYADFDLSVATSDDRRISQHIGQWAHAQGYGGIRYPTRHHPGLSCWAIFEGALLVVRENAAPLTLDDPDLQTVAAAWALPLPSAWNDTE